ncbi:MAG: Spore germination protein-like Gmad2 [Desulfotomaculum sp. 46_296]|nr:MAG: Spore germination protein-like Gmad2 [Desulfotomaculum sp. 46_296]
MKRSSLKAAIALFLAFIICAGFAGCATSNKKGTPSTPSNGQKEKKPETMRVALYFLKDTGTDLILVREEHTIPKTAQVAKAALEELINGQPSTENAFKVIPKGTKVLGISINNGLATVDFSREVLDANVGSSGEAFGIQSIVNTLTEFPTIEKVAFKVEGKLDERAKDWWGHVGLYEQPFKRDLSNVREPAIWVTTPKPGNEVSSPLTVRGSAMVFEAVVSMRVITKDGQKIAQTNTMAAGGAPLRGDFNTSISFKAPASAKEGYLEVYWASPQDGRDLDLVRIPIKFKK